MKPFDNLRMLLTAFIDNELGEQEKEQMARRLKEDPRLQAELIAETRLKEILREKTPEIKAPEHLRNRIRRDISRALDKPSFPELLQKLFDYRPMATSFAVAVIALLVILPSYQLLTFKWSSEMAGPRVAGDYIGTGFIEGEVICLDCDLFSSAGAMGKHDPSHHRPGLRTKDGTIWTILMDKQADSLCYGKDLLRQRARLVGRIFENSRYIKPTNYKLL